MVKSHIRVGWFFILIFLVVGSILVLMIVQSRKNSPGELLYTRHCANCHMEDGQGLGKVIPPLAGADYVKTNQADLPCIIRYGLVDTIVVNGVVYDQPMAGNQDLTVGQIANIINYINGNWGNNIRKVTVREVDEALKCRE